MPSPSIPSPSPEPILILSASFGDGHNTAARSIQKCVAQLTNQACVPPILDLFQEGMPRANAFLKWGYVFLTTHFPKVWKLCFDQLDETEPRKMTWDWLGGVPSRLAQHLTQSRPKVIVSTYPMYPHLLESVAPGVPKPEQVFSVVTDSLEINSVWTKAHSDRFFVTDEGTQDVMSRLGVAADQVTNTGFAVDPIYRDLPKLPAAPGSTGLRVLLFASSSERRVRETLTSLLAADLPLSQLTIVLGRHDKRLRPALERILQRPEFAKKYPLELLGWTNQVPQLLASHDLVLSKAGGATTHECFAVGVPMLVTHAIPGQEEGNARLLEQRGCGWWCDEPSRVGGFVADLLASGKFTEGCRQMAAYRNPLGAWHIAEAVLQASGLASTK